ncbi:hypothetical protein ARZXY2_3957 [Arthrobacter sp. ZXY-2]|nr:hypothetical protein ARZXY2_3957 [Arthrobacter sp. ZXY-2]
MVVHRLCVNLWIQKFFSLKTAFDMGKRPSQLVEQKIF